jgi:hypothetical protein
MGHPGRSASGAQAGNPSCAEENSETRKQLLAAAVACGVFGIVGTASARADDPPKGGAYGYWAGRLCDHVGSTTGGKTYWESRNYASRGACVAAEGQSLKRGEWDPANWPEI